MTNYLTRVAAQEIDTQLLDPDIGGFSIDQLMELAGLCCAQVICKEYNLVNFPKILVVAGPGNNGGDALVAARHLRHFGYSIHINYPKIPKKQIYNNLVRQCSHLDIPFVKDINPASYSLIVDGIFGFSFIGEIRSPFDEIISNLRTCNIPIVSIDIPSGWDVQEGNQNGLGLDPECLISLTWPKLCALKFRKKHYLGGRFLPDCLAQKYGIQLPAFKNGDQFVQL